MLTYADVYAACGQALSIRCLQFRGRVLTEFAGPGERRAMRRGYGNFERQYADGTIVGVRTTRND